MAFSKSCVVKPQADNINKITHPLAPTPRSPPSPKGGPDRSTMLLCGEGGRRMRPAPGWVCVHFNAFLDGEGGRGV
jgi:hypothetical protein